MLHSHACIVQHQHKCRYMTATIPYHNSRRSRMCCCASRAVVHGNLGHDRCRPRPWFDSGDGIPRESGRTSTAALGPCEVWRRSVHACMRPDIATAIPNATAERTSCCTATPGNQSITLDDLLLSQLPCTRIRGTRWRLRASPAKAICRNLSSTSLFVVGNGRGVDGRASDDDFSIAVKDGGPSSLTLLLSKRRRGPASQPACPPLPYSDLFTSASQLVSGNVVFRHYL